MSQPQTSKQKVAVWKIVSETEQILGAIRGRCARGKGETLPWEPAVKSPRPASADTAGCVRGCKNRFSTGGGWGKWGFKGTDAHEIKIRRASQEAQRVKNPPAMRETRVWSLGREDPLEKGMATHSSVLAWNIPWTEEPGGLQSRGPQRVRHDWATNIHTHRLWGELNRRKLDNTKSQSKAWGAKASTAGGDHEILNHTWPLQEVLFIALFLRKGEEGNCKQKFLLFEGKDVNVLQQFHVLWTAVYFTPSCVWWRF